MENYKLILYPNPILRTVCTSVPERMFGTSELLEIVTAMNKIMVEYGGIGLSAPQIGQSIRMLTLFYTSFDIKKQSKATETVTLCNPIIIRKSENLLKTQEGCLSIPGISVKLNIRHAQIDVQAFTPEGKIKNFIFFQQEAISFQHEYDHLEGITLFQRCGSAQRELNKNKYKKLLKTKYNHIHT